MMSRVLRSRAECGSNSGERFSAVANVVFSAVMLLHELFFFGLKLTTRSTIFLNYITVHLD